MTEVVDRLRYTRVMPGEYRCDLEQGTYYIWRHLDGWKVTFSPSYGMIFNLGTPRTLRKARILATDYAKEHGHVIA